jgi:hypothetical protein
MANANKLTNFRDRAFGWRSTAAKTKDPSSAMKNALFGMTRLE